MENQDIIWAAGFMDGEGTIGIKRYIMKRNGKIYYTPYISCSQSVVRQYAVEYLKKIFGGSVGIYKASRFKDNPDNRMDTAQWVVASRKAENAAKLLLPYLKVKRKNAELLLKFYELPKPKYRLSNGNFEEREKLFQQIRLLNEKGALRLKRLSEKTPKGDATV